MSLTQEDSKRIGQISRVEQRLGGRIDQVEERIGRIEHRLDRLEDRVHSIDVFLRESGAD